MEEIKTIKVTQAKLKEGVYDGVMHFKCPYCGHNSIAAEPDADSAACQNRNCNKMVKIDNPYF
jgi:predicted RNA-binding Zn-ribbon protein involved in translation (DUF1610 family)